MIKNNQKIPERWSVKTLGELGQFVSGGTPDTEKHEYWNGDIIWLTPSEITKLQSKYVSDSERKITALGLKNSSAVVLPPRSLIICTRATVGDCCISATKVSTNQGFKNLIPENNNVEFLYYLIRLHKNDLLKKASGSTFLEISKHDIEKLKYPIPPLPEQEKIAEILGCWDEGIEKLSALIEKKKIQKKALMQQLLTGKHRLKGFSTPWHEVMLGELGEFSKGTGITKNDLVETGLPCIRYAELYTRYDFIIKKAVSCISADIAKQAVKINKGTLVLAGSGETKEDIGKSACYESDEPAYVGGDTIIFLPKKVINTIFLSYFLNTAGRRQLNALGQGDSIVHIHSAHLKNVLIPVPPLPEQEKIAEILGCWDLGIEKLSALIDAKKQLKKGLMQKLLTGQIRVKVA